MAWEQALDQWITDNLPDLEVKQEEPMSRHTSFRTGGEAHGLSRER